MEDKVKTETRRGTYWTRGRICLWGSIGIVTIALAWISIWAYTSAFRAYHGHETTLVIPSDCTDQEVADALKTQLGDYGETVYRLWSLRDGDPAKATGFYVIKPGDKAWSVASRIKSGASSTVTVTFNNVRLMSELAHKVSAYFPWSAEDFIHAADSILPTYGFKTGQAPAAFWPNTYQFYMSATPAQVVTKLVEERNGFWNEERRAKAKSLGFTPVEIATIASIAEEESANAAERPVIARLYMNRLKKGMKLQADPTVKYALGDFSLKRIYQKHLEYESPYNTYRVNGLPPGPIRIPDGVTIDAVLNSLPNNYIYMCAKPDNSGTHNFTDNYNTHLANAKAYRAWVDSLGL